MESIRIKSESLYEIEVNDNGDVITFDLDDIELPLKIDKCIRKLKNLALEITKKEKEIHNRPDFKENEDDLMTVNERELAEIVYDTYVKSRAIMDELLGDGACQKIFGNANYSTMFDDLLEALEPHFTKMKAKQENVKDRIKAKYSKVHSNELT